MTSGTKFTITPDTLARLAHISDEEVRRDIADTQAEIDDMRRRAPLLRALGDGMSVMRADAYVSGIHEREGFIAKLQALLDARAKVTS